MEMASTISPVVGRRIPLYLHHTDINVPGCLRLTLSSGRVQRLARMRTHREGFVEELRCKSSQVVASCSVVLHALFRW